MATNERLEAMHRNAAGLQALLEDACDSGSEEGEEGDPGGVDNAQQPSAPFDASPSPGTISAAERAQLLEALQRCRSSGDDEMLPLVEACLRDLEAHDSAAGRPGPCAEHVDVPPQRLMWKPGGQHQQSQQNAALALAANQSAAPRGAAALQKCEVSLRPPKSDQADARASARAKTEMADDPNAFSTEERPAVSSAVRKWDTSAIAEQFSLLTEGWMREGTLQTKICKYGINLRVREVVHGIVDEAFVTIDQNYRSRREIMFRWVRLSRLAVRVDGLTNPRPCLPASIEARMAARKERREQQDQIRLQQEQPKGQKPLKQKANASGATVLNEVKAPPGFNSERRAAEKQLKVMEKFLKNHLNETRADLGRERRPERCMPEMARRPQWQDSTVSLPPVPKRLEGTYSTYMHGVGRLAKSRSKSVMGIQLNAGKVRPAASHNACVEELLQARRQHGKSREPEALTAEHRPLPRLPTSERDKENLQNRRSASADPALQAADARVLSASVIPGLTKKLQHSSGIFRPHVKKASLGGSIRSGVPTGVSLNPMADGECIPSNSGSDGDRDQSVSIYEDDFE